LANIKKKKLEANRWKTFQLGSKKGWHTGDKKKTCKKINGAISLGKERRVSCHTPDMWQKKCHRVVKKKKKDRNYYLKKRKHFLRGQRNIQEGGRQKKQKGRELKVTSLEERYKKRCKGSARRGAKAKQKVGRKN